MQSTSKHNLLLFVLLQVTCNLLFRVSTVIVLLQVNVTSYSE